MPCGVGSYTLQLARSLAARPGVDVAVLTSKDAGAGPTGVTVLPVMDKWTFGEVGRVVKAIREWRPDLVHVQYPTLGYGFARMPVLVPLISWLLGKRVVCTFHEPYDHGGLPRFVVQSRPAFKSIVVRPNYEALLPRMARWFLPARNRVYIASESAIPRCTATLLARAALRAAMLDGRQRLVVFFGFLSQQKGADRLFDICNPATDHIVFVGQALPADCAGDRLAALAAQSPWAGHVSFTGFLSETECADMLAAADAVVLPFRNGGGVWNSSIQAAVQQGVAVITTSYENRGLDRDRHVHWSGVDDIDDMRSALDRLAGTRRDASLGEVDEWHSIAARHCELYQDALTAQQRCAVTT